MTDIRLDWAREARTGVPEAIYCASKTTDQIDRILAEADERQASLLLTRLSPEAHGALIALPALDYDPLSRTAILDHGLPAQQDLGAAVVAAGTSDAAVAREAERTLTFAGLRAPTHIDVGVAGLWRTTDAAAALQDRRVIIACAGFEAALFSVLAGLVPAVVIAVPTSVGTGVAEGGKAALSSALASCAPGVVTVNIDNGFGAACAAIKFLRQSAPNAVG
ncbi:MAG: nickel pincer cofactor biosynthesis protein LarB [Pseudomonadota bacterium]